jgi:uncharacterized protein
MNLALLVLRILVTASPASPTPADQPEEGWRAHAGQVREKAVNRGSCVWHAVAEKAAPGFQAVPTSDGEAGRLGSSAAPLFISKKPILDIRRIRGAQVRWPGMAMPPAGDVFLEWDVDTRKRVRETTTAYTGKKVAIFVNGKLLSVPVVTQAIDTDTVQVASTQDFSGDDLEVLLRALNPPVDAPFVASFVRRCEAGHAPTCRVLGDESLRGRDLPFDPGKAFQFLRQACEGGQLDACGKAADVAVDLELPGAKDAALLLWEKACGGNHLGSCFRLGSELARARGPEAGTTRAKAKPYFAKACDGGNGRACMDLARLLSRLEGKPAEKKAIVLMGRACDLRVVHACLDLAEFAWQATPPDRTATQAWFTKACAIDPRANPWVLPPDPSPVQLERMALMRAAGCTVDSRKPRDEK